MKILDIDQQSPAWFAARAGVPSASCFDKVLTTTGKLSTQVEKYGFQLAGEKIIGTKEESYQNEAMKRGVELEPEARLCYELMTGNTV
jgi:YqaJ viral recombinase family.